MFDAFTPLTGRRVPTNGTELHVVEAGSGPPLVFIHGLGWSHALFRRQIERYGDRYRVVAGDTRGHASSAKPPGPYSMDDLAADWRGVLDALHIRHCAIVGFSQGGMIAMKLAAEAPERIAALALLGTASYFAPEAKAIMEERLAAAKAAGPKAGAEAAARGIFSAGFAGKHPDVIARFVDVRSAASGEALAAATRALFDFDIRPALGRVRCPVTILHGDADRLLLPDHAREIARLLPQAELAFAAGAGHMLPLEAPQLVDETLDRFLAAHYPRETSR
jgi:pimeloyl-ACP methyl ester carboxylesterase